MLRIAKWQSKSQNPATYVCYLTHIVGGKKKKHWILKLWLSRVQTYCHLSRWPHSLRYWFTSCMDPGPQGSSFSQGEQSLSCSVLLTFLILFHAFNLGPLMPRLMFIYYTTLTNATSLNPWAYEMWEASADNKQSNKLKLQGRSVCVSSGRGWKWPDTKSLR